MHGYFNDNLPSSFQNMFGQDNLGNEERNGEGIGGIEADNTEDDNNGDNIDHEHVDDINVVVINQTVSKSSKKKSNLSPGAVTFTPAPMPAIIPIPAGRDPMMQYMTMMMNQMQESILAWLLPHFHLIFWMR